MQPSCTLRPATREDLPAWADLVMRADPTEYVDFEQDTPAALIGFDQSLAAAGSPVTRLLAFKHTQLVGVAAYFRVPWSDRQQHYWATLRVDAAFRQQGIGRVLWHQVRQEVRSAGGHSIAIETRIAANPIITVCKQYGLTEVFRSIECIADPANFDCTPFQAAHEKTAASAITIHTLPELQQADTAWLPKLHALYITLCREVPIPERATISQAEIAEFIAHMPSSLPEACFIACDQAGNYAGISFMHQVPGESILLQKLTGVLPAYRGRSIGLTLKLHTMTFARQYNYQQIITWIESNNQPMLALSHRMGFVQQPGGIAVMEYRFAP